MAILQMTKLIEMVELNNIGMNLEKNRGYTHSVSK